MEREFLSSYRRLVVETAHRRGAPATGGMVADTLDGSPHQLQTILSSKRAELAAGCDGFLLWDLGLVSPCRQLCREPRPAPAPALHPVTPASLLTLPGGGISCLYTPC